MSLLVRAAIIFGVLITPAVAENAKDCRFWTNMWVLGDLCRVQHDIDLINGSPGYSAMSLFLTSKANCVDTKLSARIALYNEIWSKLREIRNDPAFTKQLCDDFQSSLNK